MVYILPKVCKNTHFWQNINLYFAKSVYFEVLLAKYKFIIRQKCAFIGAFGEE